LEGRKGLDFLGRSFAGLSAGVNATFQTSSVEYGNFLKESLEQGDVYTSSRKMDGQPDVLYNLNLVYSPEDAGLTVGLFYNLKGETYVSGESWSPSAGYVPNTVELPVDTVDFAMSYRFRKHWKVGFDVKNIFAPTVETVYRGAMGELPNTSYRSARTFGLSLGCEWRCTCFERKDEE